MTPVEILRELLKVDKATGTILLVGIAVISTTVIVQAWQVDLNTAILTGLYVAGVGASVYVGSQIINDPMNRLIIGRALSILFVVVLVALLVSALAPGRTFLPPIPCLVRFWEPCPSVIAQLPNTSGADRLVAQLPEAQRPAPVVSTPPASSTEVIPSDYRVFVQFAGVIRREDVVALSSQLRATGWRVQGANLGGERTPQAAGVNEVRYSVPADEVAAGVLAQQATAAGLGGRPVRVTKVQGISPNTLELWLSR